MSKVHQIVCPACKRTMVWDDAMRLCSDAPPCPHCVDAVSMELEEGMMGLVSRGEAVIVGKTKDGGNIYELVNA